MKTVDDLLQELKSLEINKRCFDGSTYKCEVVSPSGFDLVENLIRGFFLEQYDSKIGEMQGKIFAYEEIIKKSNFAPFVEDNLFKDALLNVQKAIAKYETEKVREIPTSPLKEETKETTEKETMFYSEFRESDDFGNTDCIYWFDLSGNVVIPDMGDKILKYYRYKSGDLKIMIAFIEKQRKGE